MDTQELMKMIKMENSIVSTDPLFVDQKSSLGFMELLGFQDFYSNELMFDNQLYEKEPQSRGYSVEINGLDDHENEDLTVDDQESLSSVVLNVQSPNSCSISSHVGTNQQLNKPPMKQCMKEKKTMGCGDETKTKKKKKEKEARFAFLTRSEIDHLDDGYRWRKYGQKAVKNSQFPRSYYRCTSASCNVKKRVERCMGDPSYVVTTYEGQHTHPVNSNSAPLIPSFNHLMNPVATVTPPAMLKVDQLQGGLLQDMLHYH